MAGGAPAHAGDGGEGRVLPLFNRHWPRRERLLREEDCSHLIARIKIPWRELVDRSGVAHGSLLLNHWLLPLAAWLQRNRLDPPRVSTVVVAGSPACNPALLAEMLQLVLQRGFNHEVVAEGRSRLAAQNRPAADALVLLHAPGEVPPEGAAADVLLFLDRDFQICGVRLQAKSGVC